MILTFNSFSVLIELVNMIRFWSFECRFRKIKTFIIWSFNIVRCTNVIILVTNFYILILFCLKFNSLFTVVSNELESVNRFKNVILNSSYVRNVIRFNSSVFVIDHFVVVPHNNDVTYRIIPRFYCWSVKETLSSLLSLLKMNSNISS